MAAHDMSTPLVSVVIPTCDRAAYLGEAIDSALDQQGVALEVIVVDDGSTDETPAVLAGYRGRIRVLERRQRSGRPGVPANAGASVARGRYLAFLDSDDRWVAGKLRRQVDALERSGAGFSYGNLRFLEPDGTLGLPVVPEAQLRSGWILRELVQGMFVHTSTFVVHRSAFEQAGGVDEHLEAAEYYPLLLRLAALERAACVSEPLADVRRHPGQNSRLQGARNYEAAMEALARLLDAPPRRLPLSVRVEVRRSLARHATHLARLALDGSNGPLAAGLVRRALGWYPLSRVAWRTVLHLAVRSGARPSAGSGT